MSTNSGKAGGTGASGGGNAEGSSGNGGKATGPSVLPGGSFSADNQMFDEPDDELEEFDELGRAESRVDPEVAEWDEDWDATGWDDEDVNDEFLQRLQRELDNFKANYTANTRTINHPTTTTTLAANSSAMKTGAA